jgi:hypothetical protein
MKTKMKIVTKGLPLLLLLAAAATRAGDGAIGEELAVVQAMATLANRDARVSYDYLYFESDFPASPIVANSMSNPDRTEYCGLSRDDAQSLVTKLVELTAKPVEFDNSLAKPAGLRVGHKKLPRFRYLIVSRVVFAPDLNQAWLAVDFNGMSGAVMRFDKIEGRWSKTARCGGWLRAE